MKRPPVVWALVVALAFLVGVNAYLFRHTRQLERMKRPHAEVGIKLEGFKGIDSAGRELNITYGARQPPVVLMVFSPLCEYCERNVPQWLDLTRKLSNTKTRIVAVDMSSSTQRAQLTVGPSIPATMLGSSVSLITKPDPRSVRAHSLWLTPQTMLIDSSGILRGLWTGVMTNDNVADLVAAARALNGSAP